MPSVPRLNLSMFSGSTPACSSKDKRSTPDPRQSRTPASAPASPRTASPEKFEGSTESVPAIELSSPEPLVEVPSSPRLRPSMPPQSQNMLPHVESRSGSSSSTESPYSLDSQGRTSLGTISSRRSETLSSAPIRYSRSGNYVGGGEMSDERDIYDYFKQFVQNYNPNDVLVYGRTRREAVQQYGHIRHFWLVELWMNAGFRYLLGNKMFASCESHQSATPAGARILTLSGFTTNQYAWIVASDYPTAEVHGCRLKWMWPKYVTKPEVFAGPENFTCRETMSMAKLPYEDNFFDIVTSRSLAYIAPESEIEEAVASLHRVTKPGGRAELYFRLRDLDTLHCFGLTVDEFSRYEAKWKAALASSGFVNIRRVRMAFPEGWGSDVKYVSELVLLYYRIVHLQYNVGNLELPTEATLEKLVRLDKRSGMVSPVSLDIYTMEKPL